MIVLSVAKMRMIQRLPIPTNEDDLPLLLLLLLLLLDRTAPSPCPEWPPIQPRPRMAVRMNGRRRS
jgi:hypothetical protein